MKDRFVRLFVCKVGQGLIRVSPDKFVSHLIPPVNTLRLRATAWGLGIYVYSELGTSYTSPVRVGVRVYRRGLFSLLTIDLITYMIVQFEDLGATLATRLGIRLAWLHSRCSCSRATLSNPRSSCVYRTRSMSSSPCSS